MSKQIIQIENTNSTDFKNEIVNEFKIALQDFATNTQSNDNNILLTRDDTAKMLSVSLVTLWDWTRKDLIPAYRIGNKVRYKKSEVLDALQKMNKFSS